MHSCALTHLADVDQAPFIDCSMSALYPPASGPRCAEKLGLDFTPIEACLTTNGPQLLADNGDRTHSLNPALYYVPWLLYDGVFSEEDLDQSQVDFQSVLCEKLGNSNNLPPLCLETKIKV